MALAALHSPKALQRSHTKTDKEVFLLMEKDLHYLIQVYTVYIYLLDFSHRYQNDQNDAIFEAGDTFLYLIYLCMYLKFSWA